VLAGAGRLDGGVERQQVGLLGHVGDGGGDLAMAWACSASARMLSAVAPAWDRTDSRAAAASSTALRPAVPDSRVRWTASPTRRASWAVCSAVCDTSSTVVAVSVTAAPVRGHRPLAGWCRPAIPRWYS